MDYSLLQRVERLTAVFNILQGFDKENAAACAELSKMVDELRNGITKARDILEEKKAAIEEMKEYTKRCESCIEYIENVNANIPDEIVEENVTHTQCNNYSMQKYVMTPVNSVKEITRPLQNLEINNFSVKKTVKETNGINVVEYITNSEFNTILSYMRGRLTVESVNSFVDIMNQVLTKKYNILNQPRNKLLGNDLKLSAKWKTIVKDASLPTGSRFCTANDFLTLEQHKLSKLCYSKIVILRHLKRIREVRLGTDTLYVIS